MIHERDTIHAELAHWFLESLLGCRSQVKTPVMFHDFCELNRVEATDRNHVWRYVRPEIGDECMAHSCDCHTYTPRATP